MVMVKLHNLHSFCKRFSTEEARVPEQAVYAVVPKMGAGSWSTCKNRNNSWLQNRKGIITAAATLQQFKLRLAFQRYSAIYIQGPQNGGAEELEPSHFFAVGLL